MMKSVFFDNYDKPLLRIDSLRDVHNHSQLVVAPDTVAYIRDGDTFYGPLYPGVHTLATEIGWIRNGVHGRFVTVYRIATSGYYLCKSGTGKFYFKSPDLWIRHSAKAPFTLDIKIANAKLFIEMVKHYTPQAGIEALDQFFVFLASSKIREVLRLALNKYPVESVDLVSVASAAARMLRPEFAKYGIELVSLTIDGLNEDSFTQAEIEVAKLKELCGDDKAYFRQYLLLTQSKASISDLIAFGNMMPQDENKSDPPDTWGGI